MTLVCISGTPGTGKTAVARILSVMLGYKLIDVNGFAGEHGLIIGTDARRKSKIVDIKKLKKETARLKGNIIIEGHLSHFAKCDICVVLRTNPEELKGRLKKKGWSGEKIAENVEAEILDVCLKEAVDEHGIKKVFEVDTSGKKPENVALEIKGLLEGKKRGNHKPGKVDWMGYLGWRRL